MTIAPSADDRSHSGNGSLSEAVARGLGWFSLALGTAEFVAPGTLARVLGMEGNEALIRAYGAREMITGVGILTSADALPWLWGRVGGDALDIATLVPGLRSENPRRGAVGLAMAAVAGVTAVDVACAQALAAERQASRRPVHDYSDRSGLPAPPGAMRGRGTRRGHPPGHAYTSAFTPVQRLARRHLTRL